MTRYVYHDADGKPAYAKVREDDPDGKRCHWESADGKSGLDGAARVVYRLPDVRKAIQKGEWIVWFEGEKCADIGASLGFTATTAGSASDWRTELREYLRGARVAILSDRDAPGRKHADAVMRDLAGVAVDARIVADYLAEVPGDDADGADIEQFAEHFGLNARTRLLAYIEAMKPYKPADDWPEPLAREALHGLPGDFVRLVEPHTEADPAALLFSFLAAAGAALGRGAYYEVSGARHAPNLFTALIGASATARKGTSYAPVEQVIRATDATFADSIASGLTSGEGLIYHVRDSNGKDDPGVDDKRLLLIEEELAGVLRAGSRQSSTLSPVLRNAWDGRPLRTMAKNSPCKAAGAHVSLITHCTFGELRETLHRVDVSNGFANRFLWVLVRRSKSLPDGGALPMTEILNLGERLREAMKSAAKPRRVMMNAGAREIWGAIYESLNEERPGAFGTVTARGPAQVLRLSLIYALLDLASTIGPEHLTAALAVWKYADESARLIFGADEEHEDRAVARARAAIGGGEGATRTELRELFSGDRRDEKLNHALNMLFAKGEIEECQVATDGRPVTIYRRKGAA